jgi:hypothetical protein
VKDQDINSGPRQDASSGFQSLNEVDENDDQNAALILHEMPEKV